MQRVVVAVQVYNWRPELVCPNIHRPPELLLLISPFISRLEAASQNSSYSIRSQSHQPFTRKLSRDAELKSDQFTIVLQKQIKILTLFQVQQQPPKY